MEMEMEMGVRMRVRTLTVVVVLGNKIMRILKSNGSFLPHCAPVA